MTLKHGERIIINKQRYANKMQKLYLVLMLITLTSSQALAQKGLSRAELAEENKANFDELKDNITNESKCKIKFVSKTREGGTVVKKARYNGQKVIVKTNWIGDRYAPSFWWLKGSKKYNADSVLTMKSWRDL